MSSILTNSSAMVALQTMRSVNKGLAQTQAEISTGKSIGSARDNAAVWSISKTMESDVKGFKAISDSLALGKSTVAVARQASETVTDLLTEMKGRIVAAQESNVDRVKINDDVTALKNQIKSVVGAAQFNGLNLVDGSAGNTDVLSSLDRGAGGSVTSSSITVTAQNLSSGGYTAKEVFTGTDGVAADSGDAFGFSLDGNGGTDDAGTIVFTADATAAYAAGDRINISLGEDSISYTITEEDIASTTIEDVLAVKVKDALEASGANVSVDYDSGTGGTLTLTNEGSESLQISGQLTSAGSGGLGALDGLNVSSQAGAEAALETIETMIDTAVDAAASFGSDQKRIDTQAEFVSNLTDSLTTGIGSLVDADMEATSARLQALQVQQQLGTQSLSIANQQPQNILSLFR